MLYNGNYLIGVMVIVNLHKQFFNIIYKDYISTKNRNIEKEIIPGII